MTLPVYLAYSCSSPVVAQVNFLGLQSPLVAVLTNYSSPANNSQKINKNNTSLNHGSDVACFVLRFPLTNTRFDKIYHV